MNNTLIQLTTPCTVNPLTRETNFPTVFQFIGQNNIPCKRWTIGKGDNRFLIFSGDAKGGMLPLIQFFDANNIGYEDVTPPKVTC